MGSILIDGSQDSFLADAEWSNASSGLSTYQVVVDGCRLSLAEFLICCADGIGEQPGAASRELRGLQNAFLAGGLGALQRVARSSGWVQVGLHIPQGRSHTELYRRLACVARELLAQPAVSNFFFMHKPPGLRVRFETTGPGRDGLAQELYERFSGWQEENLIEQAGPAVYEPEAHLFGGPVSMWSVHRLFTIDSLAWLDYHVLAGSPGEEPGPAWALSLAMLRALFDGLEIVGWEDLDVWDRVRRKTGRQLGEQALGNGDFARVADPIRAGWADHQWLLAQLPPQVREIAETYRQAVGPETARWRREYFATREAYLGPREAAAYLVIFHWNRAALPFIRQALLTEALAARQAD